jgi:hypothetical protein
MSAARIPCLLLVGTLRFRQPVNAQKIAGPNILVHDNNAPRDWPVSPTTMGDMFSSCLQRVTKC